MPNLSTIKSIKSFISHPCLSLTSTNIKSNNVVNIILNKL